MSQKEETKKTQLLGMPFGTAAGRLRKAVLFHLAVRLKENFCFRCGVEIETAAEFSLEHKNAWQGANDPVSAFFDLENVAFSHHSCNCSAASRPHKKYASNKERSLRNGRLYYSRHKKRLNSKKKEYRRSLASDPIRQLGKGPGVWHPNYQVAVQLLKEDISCMEIARRTDMTKSTIWNIKQALAKAARLELAPSVLETDMLPLHHALMGETK